MSGHEQFAEDLSLYAVGALEGEDRRNLERHLATCGDCRTELEHLRGDGVLLALSVMGPKPPQRARQRLMDALAKEPRLPRSVAPPSRRRSWNWTGFLGWAAAVAMLLIVAELRKENSALRGSVSTLGSLVAQQTGELADARRVVDALTSPEAQTVELVAAKRPPQPQGKAFYLRSKSSLIFVANSLPPLPPEKIYELWLIPKTGAPIPAGLFKPDSQGRATVVDPPLPAGVEAKTFAVTLEAENGPHDAPHGTGVMAGEE
jgi:anti-sigma-K factor RskA